MGLCGVGNSAWLKSLPLKVASIFEAILGGGRKLYLAWMIALQTIVEDQPLALPPSYSIPKGEREARSGGCAGAGASDPGEAKP